MPETDQSGPDTDDAISQAGSPRRRKALRKGRVVRRKVKRRIGPGTRIFRIVRKVIVGTFNDGFIHAGNLAYMSMLAIFPFFILGAAAFAAIGEEGERAASVNAIMAAFPADVGEALGPVAREAIELRSGWLLWVGGLIGLWTVGSLIETIRDILRRAYHAGPSGAFFKNRLRATGIIILAIIVLITSLFAQVMIGAIQQVISAYMPALDTWLGELSLSRVLPAAGLFASTLLLFSALAPDEYIKRPDPKWPGALVVTLWWLAVSAALPPLLHGFFTYDLTYGSIAGVIIALFFFYLVGLGVVIGAELNAALALTSDEDPQDEADGETEDEV